MKFKVVIFDTLTSYEVFAKYFEIQDNLLNLIAQLKISLKF